MIFVIFPNPVLSNQRALVALKPGLLIIRPHRQLAKIEPHRPATLERPLRHRVPEIAVLRELLAELIGRVVEHHQDRPAPARHPLALLEQIIQVGDFELAGRLVGIVQDQD